MGPDPISCAFIWGSDAVRAIRIVKQCRGTDDPIWRYNQAFLHFWLGEHNQALKQCEKIRKQNYAIDPIVSREVVEFNEKILSSGKGTPVLFFWIGFNYYFKQNNLPLALENFEKFLSHSDSDMEALRNKAIGWLSEIRREGKWN